jgi:hypothetical protein
MRSFSPAATAWAAKPPQPSVLAVEQSETPDGLPGNTHANVVRSPVGVADEGGHATGVEDSLEISACGLGRVSQLVPRRIDLGAGVVRLLQPEQYEV